MAILFAPPFYRATDLINAPIPGAFLGFYATQSSTYQPIYADVNLTVALANPQQSDGNGVFQAIWLDDSLPPYKYVLYAPDENNPSIPGAVLRTGDPYNAAFNANQLGAIFNPITQAENTASVVPITLAYREGDVRRYGATQGASDNSLAINNALKVSDASGNACYLPGGTWAHTSPIIAVGKSSLIGEGAASILAPTGCDGIQFPASQPGSRIFRDFSIIGAGTSGKNGISCAISPAATWNVGFNNILIKNFSAAIYANGFRDCIFRKLVTRQNYYGAYFIDQNTNCRLFGCSFINDSIPAGTGGSEGIAFRTGPGAQSTQSTQFFGCYVYGYEINVNHLLGFETQFEACDFSNALVTCVNISGVIKNFRLIDSWVETNAAVTTSGVIVAAQAVDNGCDIRIRGCTINCTTAHAGSIGVAFPGANQNSVILSENHFDGWETGIKNVACDQLVSLNNSFNNITTQCHLLDSAFSTNTTVSHSRIKGATTDVVFTGATPVGFKYSASGSFTLSVLGFAAPATGTVKWVANDGMVTVSTTGISATSTGTTLQATGIPAVLCPVTAQPFQVRLTDNGAGVFGMGSIATNGTITFGNGANNAAFTASGTKGVSSTLMTWPYL